MALDAHLAELSDKHRALDKQIEDLEGQPGSDDLIIHELKREKLKLKDEIARLEQEQRQQAG